MLRKILPLLLLTAFAACGRQKGSVQQEGKKVVVHTTWEPPAAGIVVDRLEERVTEDRLNETYFRVTVIATDQSKAGAYLLKLERGFNINETEIALPKWVGGAVLKPVLKKGPGKYTGILGFDAGDGVFHELYQIKVNDAGSIALKQTKGYYQTTP